MTHSSPDSDSLADLIDRLKNPMWAHSTAPFWSPQLEQEQTIKDMIDAADEIARLREQAFKYLQECGRQAVRADNAGAVAQGTSASPSQERQFLINALDALEAIESEIILTGHLKELADCALAARGSNLPTPPQPAPDNDLADLLSRLDDQGLFSKAERIQMIKDAAATIRRLCAPPQEVPLDDLRKTISDEWGSHLCYRDSFGKRSCRVDDPNLGCRCTEIAAAILTTYSLSRPERKGAGK